MRNFLLSLLFIFPSSFLFAQKQANVWYFGEYGGLDFNSGAPAPLLNSMMYTNEGCASMADKTTGSLLFYTDGTDIYDRSHNIMPNGFGLGGSATSTQAAICVPKPGSNTIYYIFTVDPQAGYYGGGSAGLNYNIVDMTLNGGFGDVTLKNQLLLTPTSEKVTAVKHCNGRDIWVVTHRWNSNAFYAYLLSPAGISAPVISNSGIIHQDIGSFQNAESIGYMKFSPDAKKLALACYLELNTVQIFDFNNTTGVISNPITDTNFPNISGSDGPYGVSFSPDNSSLYVDMFSFTNSLSNVYQYNMLAGSSALILASRTVVGNHIDYGLGAIQIGPDGKIYIAHHYIPGNFNTGSGSNYLDVINSPNALGAACNFVANGQNLGGTGLNLSWWGLPDMVESYLIPPYTVTATYNGCISSNLLTFTDSINGTINLHWNFGDPASGTLDTSSLQNPAHTYSSTGSYTVTLILANACKTDTIKKTVNIGTFTFSTNVNTSICKNNSTVLTSNGAPSGSTYSWSPSAGLSSTTGSSVNASPTSTTTYTVIATTSGGCTTSNTITVTVDSLPVISTNASSILCNGQSATLSASGGSSYTWSPSSGLSATTGSIVTANPAFPTTYSVTGTDGNNCSSITTITITQPAALSSSTSNTNVSCNGGNNATAIVAASGGAIGYNYLWSNGQTASNALNLSSGSTFVTVTDANGCKLVKAVIINEPTPIGLTPSEVPTSCFSSCDGLASVIASGGTPGYSYYWQTNGQTTVSAVGLCAGNYTVIVTDNNGCTKSATANITQPSNLFLSSSSTQTGCTPPNGTASVTASGGTSPYSYAWSNNQSTPTATGLSAGTYTVIVSDLKNCSKSSTIVVTQTSGVTASIPSASHVLCNGQCNGSASALASGGYSPFSYSWSNGQLTANASGLCQGVYSVSITDANNCFSFSSVTISQPALISLSSSSTQTACSPDNGTASVSASGGTNPFLYQWNNNQTTTTAIGLSAGTYSATISDNHNCSSTTTVTVTKVIGVNASLPSFTNASCFNQCNGTAHSISTGGALPYSYSWSNGQTFTDASALCAGTYNLTVTDANNCFSVNSVTISQPSALSSPTNSTPASCNGGGDGTVSVIPTGGTVPYSYYWSNGQTSSTASGLSAGTYPVTVTDSKGCIITTSATVIQPSSISLSASSTATGCTPPSGTASVTASGGTSPYSYAWSNNQSAPTSTGLSSGNYTVTVTDGKGCTNITSVIVTSLGGPNITSSQTNVTCNGWSDGSATISASGSSPFNYYWSPNAGTTFSVSGLHAGTYTVTVADNKGCKQTQSVMITEPPPLVLNFKRVYNICAEGSGSIQLTASGGASYFWSPPTGLSNSNIADPVATVFFNTTYTVTVSIGQCSDTAHITINLVPVPIPPTISQIGDSIFVPHGYINYQWYFEGVPIVGATNFYYNASQNGHYAVFLTDTIGCKGLTSSINIIVLSVPISPELRGSGIKIYPNPATESFIIQFPGQIEERSQLIISDILGRVVFIKDIVKEKQVSIDATLFARGVYLIQLNRDGKFLRTKVVKD